MTAKQATGACDECGATDVELFPDEPMRLTKCHACGSSAIDEGFTAWPVPEVPQQVIDDLDYAQMYFPDESRVRRSLQIASDILLRLPDETPTDHPQQAEEDSYSRLLAEIAERDGVNNDAADGFDPDDRF